MNTLLVGINSKYIHPNLAIRYLKANCDFDVEMLEFTIKDDIRIIIESILETNPDLVGFSVYIWNYEMIIKIAKELKLKNKNIKILLGGPEISYESESLIDEKLVDYIITGEGEESFNSLLHNLETNNLSDVNNLIYHDKEGILRNKKSYIKNLNSLIDPNYLFEENIKNQIAYLELSRGCPYNCSYCMASLDNKLRYFDLDRVINNIDYLYKKGARTFKFLDRSFNINPNLAKEFFNRLIAKNYQNTVFQFEINGDILSEDFIEYLIKNIPENLIRFEIGIQSIHEDVNKAVNRHQNTDKLLKNIKALINSNITLHLDLIAGLPYETLEKFISTFDTVFKLYGDELQLGFLKVLKGTKIFYETDKYNYTYLKTPPYELIENKFISKEELKKIHIVENVLDVFWNKGFMNQSIKYITKDLESPFKFFYSFGLYLEEHDFNLHKYQLSDLFEICERYIKDIYKDKNLFLDFLKFDYLNHFKIKPKIYWNNSNINKNEILRKFHELHTEYKIDDLYKYAYVTDYLDGYLIVIYFPSNKKIYKIKSQI